MTAYFAFTLFISSSLLFWVQPMFAKMVLPLFGGTTAVWNSCMFFYQGTLLAGYFYAHKLSSRLSVRHQLWTHLFLFFLSLFFLPISVTNIFSLSSSLHPILSLLLILITSLGLPFFILSANSILLQKWFALKDPYFLYRASNLGSLIALLSYPLFFEPNFRLVNQSYAWMAGYIFLTVAMLGLAVMVLKKNGRATETKEENTLNPTIGSPHLTIRLRLKWLLLSLAPSSLMLSTTTYLSTDISPMPFLWVIPLSIYLFSFVLIFAEKPVLPHELMVRLLPILLLPLVLLIITEATRPTWLVLPFHLLTLFVAAMVCHGELVKSRPPVQQLTSFYLYLSLGGAAGGLFNALVGPLLFNAVIEYPLTLALISFLKPRVNLQDEKQSLNKMDMVLPLTLGLLTILLIVGLRSSGTLPTALSLKPILALPTIICFTFTDRPIRFGLGVGMLMLSSLFCASETGKIVHTERSFYGVHRVIINPEGKTHWLEHGRTVHGGQHLPLKKFNEGAVPLNNFFKKKGQNLDSLSSKEPLAYYHRTGPLGQLFETFKGKKAKSPIAVIGLGCGSMAFYGKAGEMWTFYEIDPVVERIARNTRLFTFLENCSANFNVVLGDARLSLKQAHKNYYQLIILDAFSSDAIPLHLLTRESLQLYLSKLSQNGILAFHISNRYLNLQPILGDLAEEAGLIAFSQKYICNEEEIKEGKFTSRWVIMSRNRFYLSPLDHDPRWLNLGGRSNQRVWSDDFSNIFSVFDWN